MAVNGDTLNESHINRNVSDVMTAEKADAHGDRLSADEGSDTNVPSELFTNGQEKSISETSEPFVPIQIDGEEVKTSLSFPVVNPATSKVCWHSCAVTKEEALLAVAKAEAAFPSWSKTKPSFRRDILNRTADILESRAQEYATIMDTEIGSNASFSAGFMIPLSANLLRDIAGRLITAVGGHMPICAEVGTSAMVLKEPYGVVLGIAPWNAPYVLGFRAVAYALAAGNTAVLKASELSPKCYWAIGRAFADAGLPKGCLSVIAHRPQDAAEITTAIIEHPAIKKVNFTGSTAVGSIVASTCGKNLKPCLMELGGKNCAIVLDDADLDLAAKACALGSFINSGQICMSTDMIIVQSSIASEFACKLHEITATMFGGEAPPLVLASSIGTAKNRKLIKQAVEKGAKLLHGGLDEEMSSETRQRATIVEGVTKDMDLYDTESFGPTVGVVVVNSEAEAVDIANATEHGLSAAVFTKDLARAFRVAKEVESGAVHINSMTVHDEPVLPHGGVKKSGWGRFNGSAGLEEFLKSKTITWID